MKQCGGGPADVVHRHNGLFVSVTVTEMSALVAVADLSWRQTMSNISYKKRRVRVLALEPKSSASANSAILACVVISDR
jgi:hypothetical protein